MGSQSKCTSEVLSYLLLVEANVVAAETSVDQHDYVWLLICQRLENIRPFCANASTIEREVCELIVSEGE